MHAALLAKDKEGAAPAAPHSKRRTWFGYLPLWCECLPLSAATGGPDWPGVLANVGAGLVIGMRETLGGIVSASLVFSTSGSAALAEMFPFGIGMMWYSTSLGILWYVVFGRLQYAYGTAQDVVGILQASMAAQAAEALADEPEKIPPTVICIICLSAVLTGCCSLLLGKLGLGKYMLLFPAPVTSSFLGAIGFVILRTSLQTSSGVHFHYFYPSSLEDFCLPNNLAQVGCQVAMVCFIRLGPPLLRRCFPRAATLEKLGGVVCQLLPLALFYCCVACIGLSMEDLTAAGWTYPRQGSGGLLQHWTTYELADVDVQVVLRSLVDMPSLVLMAVLCTSTGVLGITDRFPTGPPGDPNPDEAIDFDAELTTVGASSVLLGLTGGTLTFHTFTAIQLRLDGGTHRVAVLMVATFVFAAFASGAPIGHFVPRWFLSGLFMNTAVHFLKGALLSYQALPLVDWRGWRLPSPQYAITLCGILASVFVAPTTAIGIGMVLSISLFLVQSSRSSPVINVVLGNRVVSRMQRPCWELRVLRSEGNRILLLYLQGHLFFGSVRRLVAVISAAVSSERVRYCVLSFARVPQVDPSAARHLRALVDKGRHRGFRILCCRMNAEVYPALAAAGVVTAPDAELVKYMRGQKWRTSRSPAKIAADKSSFSRQALPINSPGAGEPDAFTHETDALGYCDGLLIDEFCYGPAAPAVKEPYMLAYRAASTSGDRLDEWAFEDMNGLPRGFMDQLRGFCTVLEAVPQWTELAEAEDALCFIMRGCVSLVQMRATADDVELPEPRGFSFRRGKHLHKRYPAGYVVSKSNFFLKPRGRVVDAELVPRVIVSSVLGPSAEVWLLHQEQWRALPGELQGPLASLLCVQMAEDDQHTQIQEH